MARAPRSSRQRIGEHLRDPLYRTGYFLILGTGTTAVLGVAFWALAAHTYSAEAVGLNSAVISAMALVSGVSTLGLSDVLIRYLPVAGRSTRNLIVRSYAITLALSLLVGTAVALSSGLWSSKLGFLAHGGWLIGFPLATAATTVFMLEDSVLTGLKNAHWIPAENSAYSLTKLILLVLLGGVLPGSGLFVAWNAPLPAAIIVINVLVFRRLIPARRSSGSLDRRQLLGMARGNYAGLLFDLAATLYLPVLVANKATAAQTAYFYVPWSIFIALQLVAVGMTHSLTVEAANNMTQLRALARRTFRQTMLLVLPLAAVTAAGAQWFLLAYGRAYADAGAPLLRLLTIAQIPSVLVILGVSMARIQHRGGAILALHAAQAILVLGLSSILLPSIGIKGVGVAWLVAQTVIGLVLLGTILRPLLLHKEIPPGASAVEGGLPSS